MGWDSKNISLIPLLMARIVMVRIWLSVSIYSNRPKIDISKKLSYYNRASLFLTMDIAILAV